VIYNKARNLIIIKENYQKMANKIINYILTPIEIRNYKLVPDLSFPLKTNT
jgi:hypothetical protein